MTGGFQPQQDAYQLKAGDKFRTTCYYKDGSVFKEGSQDEMCIAFLLYYPARKFAGFPFVCPYPGRFPCAEEYVATDLNGYEDLGRVFGTSGNELLSNVNVTLPQPPVISIEPPAPTPTSSSNTGEGEKPTYAAIPTSETPETDDPTSSYDELGGVIGTSGNGLLSSVTLPHPPVISIEPTAPTPPSSSNTDEEKPTYVPIPTSEASETGGPTSRAKSTNVYYFFAITALSYATMMLITFA